MRQFQLFLQKSRYFGKSGTSLEIFGKLRKYEIRYLARRACALIALGLLILADDAPTVERGKTF